MDFEVQEALPLAAAAAAVAPVPAPPAAVAAVAGPFLIPAAVPAPAPRHLPRFQPESLEDLCVDAYLTHLETEAVAMINVAQSDSPMLRSVAGKMASSLRRKMSSTMSGLASASLREKMLQKVLSQEYPTTRHCKSQLRQKKDDLADDHLENLLADVDGGHQPGVHSLFSNCVNTCCTGAHVQEAMASVIINCDVRNLVFTIDRMNPRRLVTPYTGIIDFDAPLVLSYLVTDAHENHHSQLEKLIFSENFVKEDSGGELRESSGSEVQLRHRKIVQEQITRNRNRFTDHVAPGGGIYRGSDRHGLALNCLMMFRDLRPDNWWDKLTEVVLKNNIQCDLYSKASFQFEFLSAIGLGCPRLRVLDIFGTDTWADCLVAFFFRDAFHSLHRYLFFMENEEDESSAYHPHDVTRYCQFCIDMLHPNVLERNWTVNPVIPLLDDIYDHVLKRYPKRSFCILRNCVRLSDLVAAPKSNVFELERTADMERLGMPVPPSWKEFAMKIKEVAKPKEDKLEIKKENGGSGVEQMPAATRKSARLQQKGRNSKCRCKEPIQQGRTRSKREEKVEKGGEKEQWPNVKNGNTSPNKDSSSPATTALKAMVTRSARKRSLKETPVEVTKADASKNEGKAEMGHSLKKRLRSSLGNSDGGSSDRAASSPSRKSKLRQSQRRNPSASGTEASSKAVAEENDNAMSPPSSDDEYSAALRVGTMTMTHKEWDDTNVDCYCSNMKMECFKKTPCPGKRGRGYCKSTDDWEYDTHWVEPAAINYREITAWPHLNKCIQTLEVLNIGGSNVLGEFIPFMLLYAPKLKSLGQWFNTMIYGVELLRQLPGHENDVFPNFEEFSYSTDRNYFCQPYIGFVPETADFKNVRREMVRMSHKVAKRITNSIRNHSQKRAQIEDDCKLIRSACPGLKKMNVVLHHKAAVMDELDTGPWRDMAALQKLVELDLVTMKFVNVKALLAAVGPRLETLTLEMDEEQGDGSEVVHIGRHCTKLKSLRLLIGDKILRGETTLHFGCSFFRHLQHLTVEGAVHLHAFAFFWGNCRALRVLRLGLVVSNEITIANVLIYDVFTLLFQVNPMRDLRELHLKNLRVRSLTMGNFLLDGLTSLEKVSSWILEMNPEDQRTFKARIKKCRERGLKIEYKEW